MRNKKAKKIKNDATEIANKNNLPRGTYRHKRGFLFNPRKNLYKHMKQAAK